MNEEMKGKDAKQLILLAKEGDAEAFSALYELFFVPLYRYVYFRVSSKEEAEDLVHTSFIKAFKSLGRFRDIGKEPLAYFYTIARNTILDFQRKKREILTDMPEQIIEYADRDPDTESATVLALMREKRQTLEEVLKHISEDQRDAIVLKYLNDWSNEEIAKFMGKTEEAVRQLQSRGLKTCRTILKI